MYPEDQPQTSTSAQRLLVNKKIRVLAAVHAPSTLAINSKSLSNYDLDSVFLSTGCLNE